MQNDFFSKEDKLIRSFGRVKSRKISNQKKDVLQNISPKYKLNYDFLLDKNNLSNYQRIILEIGFGYGDFLYKMAKNNPQNLYIGCEPHLNGFINILRKLQESPLDNILLSNEDFRLLAQHLFVNNKVYDEAIFNQIFILFPDPWPKLKHHKRRLINKDFLDKILFSVLGNNNCDKDHQVIIATDHDDYKNWILSNVLKSAKFEWYANTQNDWLEFPKYWIKTKYQKKAAIEGRKSIIIKLDKVPTL